MQDPWAQQLLHDSLTDPRPPITERFNPYNPIVFFANLIRNLIALCLQLETHCFGHRNGDCIYYDDVIIASTNRVWPWTFLFAARILIPLEILLYWLPFFRIRLLSRAVNNSIVWLGLLAAYSIQMKLLRGSALEEACPTCLVPLRPEDSFLLWTVRIEAVWCYWAIYKKVKKTGGVLRHLEAVLRELHVPQAIEWALATPLRLIHDAVSAILRLLGTILRAVYIIQLIEWAIATLKGLIPNAVVTIFNNTAGKIRGNSNPTDAKENPPNQNADKTDKKVYQREPRWHEVSADVFVTVGLQVLVADFILVALVWWEST